jgi:hypothetical protein
VTLSLNIASGSQEGKASVNDPYWINIVQPCRVYTNAARSPKNSVENRTQVAVRPMRVDERERKQPIPIAHERFRNEVRVHGRRFTSPFSPTLPRVGEAPSGCLLLRSATRIKPTDDPESHRKTSVSTRASSSREPGIQKRRFTNLTSCAAAYSRPDPLVPVSVASREATPGYRRWNVS